MSGEPASDTHSGGSIRLAATLVLVGLLVLFCLLNQRTVLVVPFGQAPLYLVIMGSAAVGALLSWIVRIVRRSRPSRDGDSTD